MIDENTFWNVIDSSRAAAAQMKRAQGQDFLDLHEKTLADAMQKLSPQEVAGFDDRFWAYHALAYRWDLWGVAYWMHGGCSDDGFIDFRSCLISLGKELFFKILNEPDSIAEIIDQPDVPYMQAEGFQYVASKVYEELTGNEMPQSARELGPSEPVGEQFEFDDEEVMREHFPKLLAKLPEMGD